MKAIGAPETATIRMLAQEYREDRSGATGTTLTLAYTPLTTIDGVGLEQVFVDGLLLQPGTDYTLDGATLTLASSLAGTEVVLIYYSYRS